MRTVFFFMTLLVLSVCLSSCNKNNDSIPIQQGDSLIEINAIYPQNSWLQVRYNNVVNVPISLTIAFYLSDGSKQNLSFTIPAGYNNPENFGVPGGDDYLNVWDYYFHSGIDSTTGTGTSTGPVITWDADVDSIRITKVSCPDARYGFKVLTTSNDWHYYLPTDPKTVLSFIANEDTLQYSDYDFAASTTWFHISSSQYGFYFFNYLFVMFSGTSAYPFHTGSVIPIPLMYYNSKAGAVKGSQPDGPEANTNGSTLQVTITRMTDKTYDATFAGKIWSSRQPDTLVFTNGVIQNALLPVKQP